MATYYVDWASGSDSTGDGSSGTPWKSLNYALTSGGVTGGDVVMVANTEAQVLSASLPTTAWAASAPLFIDAWDNGGSISPNILGVSGLPGFELNGNSAVANAWASNLGNIVVRRAILTGFTGAGSKNGAGSVWIECESYGNGSHGWDLYDGSLFFRCSSHDNSGGGFSSGGAIQYIGCSVLDNGQRGMQIGSNCLVLGCYVGRNGLNQIEAYGDNSPILQSTIEAKASGSNVGAYIRRSVVANCAFYGFTGSGRYPIQSATNNPPAILNNSYYNCAAPSWGKTPSIEAGGVTESSDPFEAIASDDIRLVSGALSRLAGIALAQTANGAPAPDIGAIQSSLGAGSGGASAIVRGAIAFGS